MQYTTAKRVFDFSVAIMVIVLASPLMGILAILIAVTSEGPVIFSQTRVGQQRKLFQCLKFRTMAAGTPDVSSHHASAAWITPVGRVLRRTKLDELPQLINVLRGEMSLVGPRPCLPSQLELVEARLANGVFDVLPGITGRAQLEGVDMSNPERLAFIDRQYISTRTFMGDLSILVRTALGKGAGDAAKK